MGYLAGPLSLRLDCILDKAETEVYSLPMRQKNSWRPTKVISGAGEILVNVGQ